MKLENCINCCCSRDNMKDNKCTVQRHKFIIPDGQVLIMNNAIKTIKEEVNEGWDSSAVLGSQGFIYQEQINILANYAYSIGEKEFRETLLNE